MQIGNWGWIYDLDYYFKLQGLGDYIVLGFVKMLCFFVDMFFVKCYGYWVVVLEMVVVVFGMVGGLLQYFKVLCWICDDEGWICILLDEVENECMYLMIFIEIVKLILFE